MRQPFYHKMQQKFITKCVRFFITKCDNFVKKCDDYYKLRQYKSKFEIMQSCIISCVTMMNYFFEMIDRQKLKLVFNWETCLRL